MSGFLKSNIFVAILIVLMFSPLRLIHLGYSEFQDDEKKAFIRNVKQENLYDFFLEQRKGPIQFFVSHIPYSITKDFRNEFAQRLPFSIINISAVLVLYLLMESLTKNKLAAFFGAGLFAVNGFTVGFSRIAQYQNLNMFFSFLAINFYLKILDDDKNIIRNSFIGTFFYCLSLYSHWDAIFYFIPAVFIFVKFLFRKDLSSKYKVTVLFGNLIFSAALLLPFMIPYVKHHFASSDSTEYFSRRVGFSDYSLERHRFIFELYNPFYTLAAYLVVISVSILFIKKSWIYIIWFIVNFLTIRYFMTKPGTHIYNYLIPIYFLSALVFAELYNRKIKILTSLLLFLFTGAIAAFYYQSFVIFVDHKKEYPWDSKLVFNKATVAYYEKEVLTFGFPHFRNWKEINEFVLKDGPECGYLSNEGKEISQIYMDIKAGKTSGCYYIVVVKRPFISTRDGVSYAQAKSKYKIMDYKKEGETLTKIYKIPDK